MAQSVARVKVPKTDEIDLNTLTKEELIERIKKLDAANLNYKQILAKRTSENTDNVTKQLKIKTGQKPFDFSVYNKRHVALHIAYFGWDWQGFTVQDNTTNTIESALFDALLRTRLIESRETSNYHRCGRTDKGVSALGQVISIDLRSNLTEGLGIIKSMVETKSTETCEIAYAQLLNRILPRDIRVLGWAPVDVDFSARFDCTKRTYTYFFPKGDLDLEKMQDGGNLMIGEHDFRNICKMDVANGVTTFVRRLDLVKVEAIQQTENFSSPLLSGSGLQLCKLTVVGSGFLWHQIRCIVALLFFVGEGLELPSVISRLLDVKSNPRKPQYNMAADFPLNLLSCEFPAVGSWIHDEEALLDLLSHYQTFYVELSIKSAMCRQALNIVTEKLSGGHIVWNETKKILQDLNLKKNKKDEILESKRLNIQKPYQSLMTGGRAKKHKPLFDRQLCESLEDRVDYFVKRRRIERLEGTVEMDDTTEVE